MIYNYLQFTFNDIHKQESNETLKLKLNLKYSWNNENMKKKHN